MFKHGMGIGATYFAEVLDSEGNVKRTSANSPNMFTSIGIKTLNGGKGTISFGMLGVGTGTNPVQFSDSSLGNMISSRNIGGGFWSNSTFNKNNPDPYIESTGTMTYDLGEVVGNITEVGMVNDVGLCCSRALFKDVNGNPTAITVLDDEILRVTVRFRLYINSEPTTGTFDLKDGAGNVIKTITYTTSGYMRNDITGNKSVAISRAVGDNGIRGSSRAIDMSTPHDYGNIFSSATSAVWSYLSDITGNFVRVTQTYPITSGNNNWYGFSFAVARPIVANLDVGIRVDFGGDYFTKTSAKQLTIVADFRFEDVGIPD